MPRGAVAEVTYYSTTLARFRRLHVYTPPGYESDAQKYPVFYLLHGAGDCDDSWTSVGRAGFIVPTGIATDDSTKAYFSALVERGHLAELLDFQSGPGLFGEIGHALGREEVDDAGEHEFPRLRLHQPPTTRFFRHAHPVAAGPADAGIDDARNHACRSVSRI